MKTRKAKSFEMMSMDETEKLLAKLKKSRQATCLQLLKDFRNPTQKQDKLIRAAHQKYLDVLLAQEKFKHFKNEMQSLNKDE